MTRLFLSLILVLSVPFVARADDVGFNNLRGPMACLRSVAFRASCPATLDTNCPKIWLASVRLCQGYKTENRFAYRWMLYSWTDLEFFERLDRRSRQECFFSRSVADRLNRHEK